MLGEREVPARTIGELVMEELRHLDEVAYVRFASVYRSFQDVEAFREEIERLRHHRRRREREASSRISCRCCRRESRTTEAEIDEPSGTTASSAEPSADSRYMRRALELAARGLNTTDPNPRVGCVLVRTGAWSAKAGMSAPARRTPK